MTSLNITNLDFDGIKADLKKYLQSQSTFNSYNFEGSGLTALINILANVASSDAYLANMVYNESFLDSAIKRASVVSKAKELGYTPKSSRAATAIVNIGINNPSTLPLPSSFTLPRYQNFTSTLNGQTLNFTNLEAINIPNTASGYVASSVNLVQGNVYSIQYSVIVGDTTEKYVIPNLGVDTTSLQVTVQNSSTDSTFNSYVEATDIQNLLPTSLVYFIEEGLNGLYYISFGDGVLGAKLTGGNIVNINYLLTSGMSGNAPSSTPQIFKLNGNIEGETNIAITTISNSFGGEDVETIDSIKFLAPKYYVSQDRAITTTDYETLISKNISGISAISVWGGETQSPPQYGKVFISLEVDGANAVPSAIKNEISSILATRKSLTSIVEFIEPQYLYVSILSKIKYDTNKTTLSSTQVNTNVKTSIQNYFNNNLSKFNTNYSDSIMNDNIITENPYINSIANIITVSNRIFPTPYIANTYSLNLITSLQPGTLNSSYFYFSNTQGVAVKAVLADDSNGNVVVKQTSTNEVVGNSVGTINYSTGLVTLNSFQIAGFISGTTDLRVYCSMDYRLRDIEVISNTIIRLDDLTANSQANINAAILIS